MLLEIYLLFNVDSGLRQDCYDDDCTWVLFAGGAYELDPAAAGDLELVYSSCRGN